MAHGRRAGGGDAEATRTARGRAAAAWGHADAVAASARRAPPADDMWAAAGPDAARRGPRTSRRPRRPAGASAAVPRRRLRAAAVAAACIGVAALLAHSRPFLLTRLSVTGLRQVSAAEVESDLGLPPATYTWQVRPWVVRRRLGEDPLIAAARAQVVWPDGLRISITERVPVALVQDGLVAWEIDAAGRLLRALPNESGSMPLAVPGLGTPVPMVVGLPLGAPAPGEVVQGAAVQRALEVATSLGAAYGAVVREVTVAADGSVGVTTVAGVPVNYGDGSQAALKTRTMLGALAYFRQAGDALSSCDVSSLATPACTVSGAQSRAVPAAMS